MKTHLIKLSWLTITMTASVAVTGAAWALGFRNPDQGARATGQGEAFVAQADDASAIYYNPAGLTLGTGTELTSGGYFDFAGSRHDGALNNTATSFLPQFYLATDFNKTNSPWRVGVGLNVPFGNMADLGRTGPFRYLVTKSSLSVLNFAPTVAYRFNEHLSLGAGANVYYGSTTTEFEYSPLAPGAHFKFAGHGLTAGATVGGLWTINDHHSIGAVYRSPFSIDFAGHAAVPGITGPSAASAQIDFPQIVAVGYAFRPVKPLKLEVDVEWTNWETLNKVKLNSPNAAISADPRATVPFNWRDSFCYEFGAQYELDAHWTARAGYIYSENSVPDSTFSPTLPDANRHVFSAGLGYGLGWMQVDVVYQYSFTPTRTVAGSPLGLSDGRWTSDGHAICVTSTLRF